MYSSISDTIKRNKGSFVILLLLILLLTCHYIFENKFSPDNMPKATDVHKIVVFDLDETLGCFIELGIFWDSLQRFYDKKLPDEEFFEMVNTFPEFLRPNILNILDYLIDKKRDKSCHKIMIYTNNQGPRSWAQKISSYFDHRIGTKIFDQIIAAFKIRGKIVEISRTRHDKSVEDLIRCTHIPKNTEICFLDDQYHPLMEHDNVYYINIKPYTFSMPFEEMADRYYCKRNLSMDKEDFIRKIVSNMKKYNYPVVKKSVVETDVDNIISKKIITHLEEFFKRTKKNTTRKKTNRSKTWHTAETLTTIYSIFGTIPFPLVSSTFP